MEPPGKPGALGCADQFQATTPSMIKPCAGKIQGRTHPAEFVAGQQGVGQARSLPLHRHLVQGCQDNQLLVLP